LLIAMWKYSAKDKLISSHEHTNLTAYEI
jgi:hypothetical protein